MLYVLLGTQKMTDEGSSNAQKVPVPKLINTEPSEEMGNVHLPPTQDLGSVCPSYFENVPNDHL